MAHPPSGASKRDTSNKNKLVVRQRKTHKKSRLGCANCKLRGVKCDESKPTCTRCTSSGLACTYSSATPALQPSYQNVFSLEPAAAAANKHTPTSLAPPPPPQVRVLQHALPSSLPLAGSSSSSSTAGTYVLRQSDKALVSRFVNHTILTFGPGEAEGHKARCMKLANAHHYLYHIYIGFAQLHQSHLAVLPGSPPRPSDGANMALHMYHSAAVFKTTLASLLHKARHRQHIAPTERDALWMGAAMLATSCFANIESLDPREVWPLRPRPSAMDLDWLRMNQGKDLVWAISDLARPESAFHDFYVDMVTAHLPTAASPIRPHALSPLFYSLFGITANTTTTSPMPSSSSSSSSSSTSTPDGNNTSVYHAAVSYLSQVAGDPADDANLGMRLFVFPVVVGAAFKRLLRERDPRALLVLVCWHARLVCLPVWWVKFRCIVEGLAICMHLRRCHTADMPDLIELLEPPRQALLAQFHKSKLPQIWPQEVIDEAEAPYT